MEVYKVACLDWDEYELVGLFTTEIEAKKARKWHEEESHKIYCTSSAYVTVTCTKVYDSVEELKKLYGD